MSTSFSFDEKENKLNCYRGKDCIKKLCKNLKKCAMKKKFKGELNFAAENMEKYIFFCTN